jgi:ubiquinone/menaquinone biosynthesis C-methylase UbiE
MHDQYAKLAPVYDSMALDPAIRAYYSKWRESLLAAVRQRGLEATTLVDLACGTGNSTIPWTRHRGWTIIGVDGSEGMLRVARRKSRAVRWIRQDLATLDLGDVRADLVTCHFDALNHLVKPGDFEATLCRAGRLLRPGGLLQFDLNTDQWLRWLAGREKLFHAGPHWFTAVNAYDAATGIATFNQVWFVKRGRLFERRLVTVQERAFTDATVRRAVKAAGLRMVRAEVQTTIDGVPTRKLYLAERPADAR